MVIRSGLIFGILLLTGLIGSSAMAQPAPDTDAPATSSVNTCLTCHNNPAVTGIRETVHGQQSIPGSPFARGGCTECHGASQEHLRAFQSPGVVFDDGSPRFPASSIADQNQACLNCHQSRERTHWSGSAHDAADLGCTGCHKIHGAQAGALNPTADAGFCFTCHLDKRGQFNRRSHHPVAEGLMSCNDCHNPHGSENLAMLAGFTVVETCTGCHAEKRGPFLWEHQPVADDCTNCHNPHGATQANLLSVRQPFLCQSCHGDTFHPSSLYSGDDIPPAGAAQQLLGSSCTNCHSTIHGSNHPSGSRLTR